MPAALIEQAARIYGAGPSLLWIGQGLQRQPTGGNVVRACALLPAVTGNVGKPGAGFLYLNDQLEHRRRLRWSRRTCGDAAASRSATWIWPPRSRIPTAPGR